MLTPTSIPANIEMKLNLNQTLIGMILISVVHKGACSISQANQSSQLMQSQQTSNQGAVNHWVHQSETIESLNPPITNQWIVESS